MQQLLDRGHDVRVIVRSADKLPEAARDHSGLSIVQASLLELTDAEMIEHSGGCDAVACCLGHPPDLRGIWGRPRRLVTDATRRLCAAVKAHEPQRPVKFVLMNTAGNRNRDLEEKVSRGESLVVGLLRLVLPPQADNEEAADYLRTHVGRMDGRIEWVAVRPDTLVDEGAVTAYEVHPSPTRSAIFDSGRTSRINVAHFMAALVTERETWDRWKGQMPVIYNSGSTAELSSSSSGG